MVRSRKVFEVPRLGGSAPRPSYWRTAWALGVVTHDPTLTQAHVLDWISVHEEVVQVTAKVTHCEAEDVQLPGLASV